MYPLKLYSGPTIQSRSAARRAAQDLVSLKTYFNIFHVIFFKYFCNKLVLPQWAQLRLDEGNYDAAAAAVIKRALILL